MGKLSTHVLDTTIGIPGSNIEIKLYKKSAGKFELLKITKTNNDGRCDEALLKDEELEEGAYELEFDVASYFESKNIKSTFLQDVVLRFYIDEKTENYHVPLLITPYSYSTYRGS